jgi:16S rRNA (guanine966-N2)-methyltransferase
LRVIGGRLKRKKLFSVPGKIVRPTADRLRESIFNIISSHVPGAVVLDLFSGTGALGIESLSRGARRVVFVENSKDAIFTIRRNIASCGFEMQAQIVKWDIEKNLDFIKAIPLNFDLVFMDPPYNKNIIPGVLMKLNRCGCLTKEARVVVEHSASEPISKKISEFIIQDQRKYGKTLVTFLSYML